jgi:hypothetical protein
MNIPFGRRASPGTANYLNHPDLGEMKNACSQRMKILPDAHLRQITQLNAVCGVTLRPARGIVKKNELLYLLDFKIYTPDSGLVHLLPSMGESEETETS